MSTIAREVRNTEQVVRHIRFFENTTSGMAFPQNPKDYYHWNAHLTNAPDGVNPC
ncbi:hypothetical protein DPMN_189259 [Dreissena polymorpha]|uniref:Uncharacterized protein n=1 Tax=Dreissena polymorpha TaxID=45954 RepID=A0A9D4DV69_DREPO|nr:hypothetical protein DPMN_189259 [Dreissena polymorpha]